MRDRLFKPGDRVTHPPSGLKGEVIRLGEKNLWKRREPMVFIRWEDGLSGWHSDHNVARSAPKPPPDPDVQRMVDEYYAG